MNIYTLNQAVNCSYKLQNAFDYSQSPHLNTFKVFCNLILFSPHAKNMEDHEIFYIKRSKDSIIDIDFKKIRKIFFKAQINEIVFGLQDHEQKTICAQLLPIYESIDDENTRILFLENISKISLHLLADVSDFLSKYYITSCMDTCDIVSFLMELSVQSDQSILDFFRFFHRYACNKQIEINPFLIAKQIFNVDDFRRKKIFNFVLRADWMFCSRQDLFRFISALLDIGTIYYSIIEQNMLKFLGPKAELDDFFNFLEITKEIEIEHLEKTLYFAANFVSENFTMLERFNILKIIVSIPENETRFICEAAEPWILKTPFSNQRASLLNSFKSLHPIDCTNIIRLFDEFLASVEDSSGMQKLISCLKDEPPFMRYYIVKEAAAVLVSVLNKKSFQDAPKSVVFSTICMYAKSFPDDVGMRLFIKTSAIFSGLDRLMLEKFLERIGNNKIEEIEEFFTVSCQIFPTLPLLQRNHLISIFQVVPKKYFLNILKAISNNLKDLPKQFTPSDLLKIVFAQDPNMVQEILKYVSMKLHKFSDVYDLEKFFEFLIDQVMPNYPDQLRGYGADILQVKKVILDQLSPKNPIRIHKILQQMKKKPVDLSGFLPLYQDANEIAIKINFKSFKLSSPHTFLYKNELEDSSFALYRNLLDLIDVIDQKIENQVEDETTKYLENITLLYGVSWQKMKKLFLLDPREMDVFAESHLDVFSFKTACYCRVLDAISVKEIFQKELSGSKEKILVDLGLRLYLLKDEPFPFEWMFFELDDVFSIYTKEFGYKAPFWFCIRKLVAEAIRRYIDSKISFLSNVITDLDGKSIPYHQEIYLRNILYPQLGIDHSLEMDLRTDLLSDTLLQLNPIETLLRLFQLFDVEALTDYLSKTFFEKSSFQKGVIEKALLKLFAKEEFTDELFVENTIESKDLTYFCAVKILEKFNIISSF